MASHCTNRCLSPIACEGFGYCRNLNKPFKVTRLCVPPILQTKLTGVGPEFKTLKISARNKRQAEEIADKNPSWFDDDNAVIERRPVN